MTIKKIKEHLKKLDQESLLEEIQTLYKKFDSVKEYYDSRFNPAENKIIEKYKKILEEQFYPKRGDPQLKYSIARKAISDFKKVCSDHLSVLDLQLTYVEYGVKCSLEYGDIDEKFYSSMLSMFEKTLKEIEEDGVLKTFQSRCFTIHKQTEWMGWGFGEAIGDLYENYFGETTSK